LRLFDCYERNDQKYAFEGEPHYDFLNRTSLPKFVETRKMIENWFAEYPDEEKNEFVKRFRSHDDNPFISAFFELFIYTLFSKSGYRLTTHFPVGRNKRIDFLVENDSNIKFFLEATVSFENIASQNQTKLENQVIEYIKRAC